MLIFLLYVDAPIQCASLYVERIDLTSKLRKCKPKWRWSRPFSGKKSKKPKKLKNNLFYNTKDLFHCFSNFKFHLIWDELALKKIWDLNEALM